MFIFEKGRRYLSSSKPQSEAHKLYPVAVGGPDGEPLWWLRYLSQRFAQTDREQLQHRPI